MAKKKDWRDYISDESSNGGEEKSSWQDYISDESYGGSSSYGGWQNYTTVNPKDIVGNNVLNRVNSWLERNNSYLSGYIKRYKSRKFNYEDAYVTDSASWLETARKQADELEKERQEILAYMDQNKAYIDPKWAKSVQDALASESNKHKSIIENATNDNEFWMKFTPNEEQKAAGYTAEKLYSEWQQYQADLNYDVEAGQKELEKLKTERASYLAQKEKERQEKIDNESWWETLGRWLSNNPDTSLPLAGASTYMNGDGHSYPYDEEIADQEAQINRAKEIQEYQAQYDFFDSYTRASDFEAKSKYKDPGEFDLTNYHNMLTDTYSSTPFEDIMYDYINGNVQARQIIGQNEHMRDQVLAGVDSEYLQEITPYEVSIYNYLYATDKNAADEYLAFLTSDLTRRHRASEEARWAELAEETPVLSSITSIAMSSLKVYPAVWQVADYIDDGKIDQNAGYNRFSHIPTAIRTQIANDIAKSGNWGEVGSWTYQLGMSMGDFLMNTAVSGGNSAISLALMGSGAMADTVIAAKDRGLSDGKALTLGVIAGGAEIITEKVSLDALLKGDFEKGAVKYILTNAFTEGTEEVSSSLINLFADIFISKEKSQWQMEINDYLEKNPDASESDAFQEVLTNTALSLGLDFLGGALMGGMMGSGGAAINYAVNYASEAETGRTIMGSETGVSNLLGIGAEVSSVAPAETKEIIAKQSNAVSKKIDSGSNSIGTARNVGRLYNTVKKANNANNASQNQTDIAKSLKRDGFDSETADALAEALIAQAYGTNLSNTQSKLLRTYKDNASVKDALHNIVLNKKSTMGQRNQNIRDFEHSVDVGIAKKAIKSNYKSLEDRVGKDGRFGVSESGKTVIRGTEEEIDINKLDVAKVGDSQLTFKVAEGREVSAGDIDFADADMSYLVSGVSDIENITPDAASVAIHSYDPSSKQTVGEYLNGFDEAFTYGLYGYSEADLKAGYFTKNLTSEQMMSAYELGKAARKRKGDIKEEQFKAMRTAAQAEAEKAEAEGKGKPQPKNLTITYNKGNGEVVSMDEAFKDGELDEKRSGAVGVAKILHRMGLGTKIEFFSSYISKTLKVKNKDGEMVNARVFLDADGNEKIAYSGVYRQSDGTIRVDLNAYNGRGLTLNALAHELTHFIQQWSTKKYKVLVDFLMKEYESTDLTMHERVLREQKRLEDIRGENKKVSYDEAYDEVVANAMSKMFDDGNMVEKLAKLKEQDKNLAQKLWEGFKDILSKFLGIYKNQSALFQDAADLMQMKETFEQLQNMFAEALVEASENYQAALTVAESQTLTDVGENRKTEHFSDSPLTRRSVKQRSVGSTHEKMSSTAAAEILGIENIAKFSDSVKEAISVLGEFYVSVDTNKPVLGFRKTISASNLEGSLIAKNVLKREGSSGSAYRYDDGHAIRISNHSANANNFVGDGEHLSIALFERGKMNDFVEGESNVIEAVFRQRYLDGHPDALKQVIHDIAQFIANGEYHDTAGAMHYNFSGTEAFKEQAKKRMAMDETARKQQDNRYSYQETDLDSTEHKINTSMTMAEAKRMIETAYRVNNIAEYYEGEYADAEDWLRKVGSDEVEMYIENDYDLQARYINSNEDILNEEYRIADVLEAYLAGTLIGKEKPKPKRLDVSQSTRLKDNRFYSPQKIKNAKATYELAKQKAIGKDVNAINRARAEILLFAHNKGAAELIGISQAELNKKLRSWSNYSATARDISSKINAGVAEENRWTGIENSSYINKAKVTNEDIERLVASVEGDSKGYERKYIARVMLAADTHIDYSKLKFKFASSQQVNADNQRGGRVLGFYDDTNRLIEVTHDKPNTVAHEMGHYIDAQWGRDLIGTDSDHLFLTRGVNADMVRARYGEPGVQFLNNFKLFINSLSDVNQNYNSYYNDRGEIFARFFARFIEWTDNIATGNKYYSYESTMYNDKFTHAQFVEFARLLQEKALLDGKEVSKGDEQYSSHETDADSKSNPYSYNVLVSKPDMVITKVDGNAPNNRADVVYQAKQNAAKVGSIDPKTGSVSVYVDDIGEDVIFGTDGLKHGLRRTKDSKSDSNYIVTLKAGEIVKNSIKVNETTPKKVDAKSSLVLIGVAQNANGDTYVVRTIVNSFSNELTSIDVLYAINAKKELAATKSPRFTAEPLSETSSTISIADLLDLVNKHFPDVLPEDVLKHYGYDARPDGELGESALYSSHETEYSNRDLLANAFEGITKSSKEYKKIQEYKSRIGIINEYEAKLTEVRREIHDIRFTKGKYDKKKLQQLENKAKELKSNIDRNDRVLLEMEASGPLRGIIDRERSVINSENLRQIRETKSIIREQKNDFDTMEKEFIRIAKAYDKLDAKSGKDAKKIADLKEALKEEAKKHRDDQAIWNKEFNRLMKEYESAGRNIGRLEEKIQKQKDAAKEKIKNREKTELRMKIRKTVRELDKILNRGNKKQNVKQDMKGFVSKALELADYLFTDHISNDELIRKGITVRMTPQEAVLVKETEDILSQLYDNADNLTDEEFTRLDEKRKANEDKLRDLLTEQRNDRLSTPVYNLFNDLVTEYAGLKNSKQEAVKDAYDPNVDRFLRSYIGESDGETDSDRKTLLQNMRVADMTTDELWRLRNAYKMVLHSVKYANTLWVKGKTETIEQMAGRLMGDFSKRKIPEKKVATVIRNLSNKIGWNYEKLYYALDRIGSEAFTELVMNIANSENTVMQDVIEAAEYRDKVVEEYGFNNWDVNKKIDREFLDNTGKKFKLTLGELMSLYAYSRRKGAWDHIEYGGFVFVEKALTNPRPADSYKLSKKQVEAITSLLTDKQKAYVEAMQKFLSETMGAKGNEVSMHLYGIEMFGEKNYFPIHIAGQFKAQANESQAKAAAGFGTMSNAGFTHAQNPNAKAPFVMEGFNEIWADHVNEMSRYHGTVPALEDMRRVMNRSSYSESGMESMAIKQLMENAFGEEAVEYFDNLYKEANSGAITDKLQKKSHKLLSLFRKNSVAYSLSVLIQQPASIVRAYAMIDRKYFGVNGFGTITSGVVKAVSNKLTKAHTNAYNEMLKYAPGVTMAKEIGGFDTHTGGSIRSYLLDTSKSLKQKLKTGTTLEKGKAVLDLVDDNAIANLPNLADKIAWIEIWNACKRETVAKHKDLATNSDEFLQIVGDRFTEVIRATQVYDSIFSKSPMLKSKNLAVQYLVSFMNEPNTVANMAEKAIRDAINGDWKVGLKTAHVVIHSIIFTSLLKSVIYAMRDDDEDETYTEKYIESLTGSLMDDFNPLSYIPLARDAWSIAQGYDVERADMAIVADFLDSVDSVIKNAMTDTDDMTEEQLAEFEKKQIEANWKLVESIASFFGIPVKNVRREVNAFMDHGRIASANAGNTTKHSAWNKIRDAVIESIPFMSTESKQDKLYDAIMSGDRDYINRLKAGYKDEDAYNSAVRKVLRENDPRIHEAAQAQINGDPSERVRIQKLIIADGFDINNVIAATNSEIEALTKSESNTGASKVKGLYKVEDFVREAANGDTTVLDAIREDILQTAEKNGKSQKEAEKDFVSDVKSATKKEFIDGSLSDAVAEKILLEYTDMDEEELSAELSYWSFIKAHPDYYWFSESNVKKYYEFGEPANISVEVYAQFIEGTKGLANIKDKWGDVEVSKQDQVIEVIDSLPLTWQQKDALFLAYGYKESELWKVTW